MLERIDEAGARRAVLQREPQGAADRPQGVRAARRAAPASVRRRRRAARCEVKVIDPLPGSTTKRRRRRLGLSAQPLGPDERLYFGLAVFHGGNRRTIPLVDYRRERLLEYDLSRLIHSVETHRLPRLAVATLAAGVRPPRHAEGSAADEDGTAEWQFVKDLRAGVRARRGPPELRHACRPRPTRCSSSIPSASTHACCTPSTSSCCPAGRR